MRKSLWLVGIVVLVSLSYFPVAHGRSKKPKCADDTGKTKYEIIRGKNGKKIFRIKTGFCIEGKVPKPSVIYVLNASTINYEWENLKQDFLPKVLRSVQKKPF